MKNENVVAKVLVFVIAVIGFELQLGYHVHFWPNILVKDMDLLIPHR